MWSRADTDTDTNANTNTNSYCTATATPNAAGKRRRLRGCDVTEGFENITTLIQAAGSDRTTVNPQAQPNIQGTNFAAQSARLFSLPPTS
jgi:hypothetical protein